jgi:hypothetical protein
MNPAEIAAVAARLLLILETIIQDNRFLRGLCEIMSTHLNAVQEVFGESAKNLLTEPLAQADAMRDGIHGRISKYLRGARFHFDEAKAKAACNLYRLFKNHGLGLSYDSYAVQSTKLSALFSDLDLEGAKNDIDTLDLSETFRELREAEANFTKLYAQKVEAEAEAKETGPVGELINPLKQDLYYVLTMLEIMERVKPDAYTDAINNVNELITEMGAKARARNNRKEEEDETGQENE